MDTTPPNTTQLAGGTVLYPSDPEPPDGTPLLDSRGVTEPYVSAEVGGRWRKYAEQYGPFVVGLDWQATVAADRQRRGEARAAAVTAGGAR